MESHRHCILFYITHKYIYLFIYIIPLQYFIHEQIDIKFKNIHIDEGQIRLKVCSQQNKNPILRPTLRLLNCLKCEVLWSLCKKENFMFVLPYLHSTVSCRHIVVCCSKSYFDCHRTGFHNSLYYAASFDQRQFSHYNKFGLTNRIAFLHSMLSSDLFLAASLA